MSKKITSRSNLFLLELIIVIAFFISSVSIILNVFVKSDELSIKAAALNNASAIMQSNAELYKSLPYSNLPDSQQIFYYDKNWNTAEATNAYYSITINPSFEDMNSGIMVTYIQDAKFCSGDKNETIFSLETKKYFTK